jgi:hypothetical protein
VLAHIGLLRWSAQETETPVDLRAVVDPTVDPLIPAGRELLSFVDATLTSPRTDKARSLRSAVGERALIMAAAVIGNFQMMNRVADATGMPVGTGSRRKNAALIEELGLARFDHLADGSA